MYSLRSTLRQLSGLLNLVVVLSLFISFLSPSLTAAAAAPETDDGSGTSGAHCPGG